MKIYDSLAQLVGSTPLFIPKNLCRQAGARATVAAKLEYFNPLGSIKDRAALFMLNDAEARGLLAPGGTVIEPTSGNTGVGLAFLCAERGYRLILTMPETMSLERRMLLAALGAEIVLTEGAKGMAGAVEKANALLREIPGSWGPDQFSNPANAEAHRQTTAKEIWADTDGKIDILVAGFGTGGTITGAGEALKALNPAIRVAATEPAASPLLSKGVSGPHKIQGVGANFIPGLLNSQVIDEILLVSDQDALAAAKSAARADGLLVGISSGAALWGALELARRPENEGKLIVAILPDTGERYLSTGVYE